MKYVFQFGVILAVSFAGEILGALIPLPIPASVYGMVIMFALLHFRVVAFEKVRESGLFLRDALVVTLLPSAVGVMAAWDVLGPIWAAALALIIVSSVIVFACAGITAQALARAKRRGTQ